LVGAEEPGALAAAQIAIATFSLNFRWASSGETQIFWVVQKNQVRWLQSTSLPVHVTRVMTAQKARRLRYSSAEKNVSPTTGKGAGYHCVTMTPANPPSPPLSAPTVATVAITTIVTNCCSTCIQAHMRCLFLPAVLPAAVSGSQLRAGRQPRPLL
jgi:hypothetical protein